MNARRSELFLPILEIMKVWVVTKGIKYFPNSQAGRAITYAYTRWENMMRCFEDERLLWDNNLTENVIRSITLGRKNYLFYSNHKVRSIVGPLFFVGYLQGTRCESQRLLE